MSATRDLLVLLQDASAHAEVRSRKPLRVVRGSRSDRSMEASPNVFVVVTATGLSDVADFVREANRRHHLRALLVRADVDSRWIVQLLDRANLRVIRNLLVHAGNVVPRRVLEAWRLGAQEQLIADAEVMGRNLMVVSCAMERLDVPVDAIAALRDLSDHDLSEFGVSESGSYIHWPSHDVHLDLDSLRAATDPAEATRQEIERARHDTRFGAGISAVRRQVGLTQEEVPGLTSRQVRRIEQGSFPRVSSLEKLALAHKMPLGDYLHAVAMAATGS